MPTALQEGSNKGTDPMVDEPKKKKKTEGSSSILQLATPRSDHSVAYTRNSHPTPDRQCTEEQQVEDGQEQVDADVDDDTFFYQSDTQSTAPGAIPVRGIYSRSLDGNTDLESRGVDTRQSVAAPSPPEQTDSALLLEATLVEEQNIRTDGGSSRIDDPDSIITATKVSPTPWRYFLAILAACVAIALVLAVTLAISLANRNRNNTDSSEGDENDLNALVRPTLPPTLEAIRDRGYIRCLANTRVINYTEFGCGVYCSLVSNRISSSLETLSSHRQ